ncbi:PTI1-like tyrosine-protein kinase At3g15890 [Aristolochia californica]|uniref:PTI1-like tyrosine-protein kinase At3g15890 n=1 Tax=Aristolochia californica TaxID=171875 RepID=UPI0035D74231
MGIKSSSSGDSVIVVLDATRSCGNLDALTWALNSVVRPRDTVIVLGIMSEIGTGRKNSCFPLPVGIGISAIWERLDFSSSAERSRKVLETPLLPREIERKREEYQNAVQPFSRQCRRNEVKLEVKLTAGSPQKLTIEEAQKRNTHWIVLDSHLKKDKASIYDQVGCNIAVMKSQSVATIMTSPNYDAVISKPTMETNGFPEETKQQRSPLKKEDLHSTEGNILHVESLSSPCWAPLSWQPGFPRSFIIEELETITNGFADDYIIFEEENFQAYRGMLCDASIVVKCFSGNHERFWSELKICGRVRHRNILNLVGYCCTEDCMFLVTEYPSNSSLNVHLRCDDMAKNLSWKSRWDIALEVGRCLCYLHEECLGGPIFHRFISSFSILLSNNGSVLLTNFSWAKWLDDNERSSSLEEPSQRYSALDAEQFLSLDVQAYGLLLMELITGQRVVSFDTCMDRQIPMDQVLPLLESSSVEQVMDQRVDRSDVEKIECMASAAMLCLRNDPHHQLSMREIVVVVRGNQLVASHW